MLGVGAPVKFAEALAAGIPVVVTHDGAAGRATTAEGDGALVSDDPRPGRGGSSGPCASRRTARGRPRSAAVRVSSTEQSWARTTEPLRLVGGARMSEPDQLDRADRAGLQDRAMRGASWTLIHVVVSTADRLRRQPRRGPHSGRRGLRPAGVPDDVHVGGRRASCRSAWASVCSSSASRAHAGGRTEDVRDLLLAASQGFRLLVVAPLLTIGILLVADVPPELLVDAPSCFGVWIPAALDGAVFCITIEGKSDVGAKIAMVTNLVTQVVVIAVAWLVAHLGRRVARAPGRSTD